MNLVTVADLAHRPTEAVLGFEQHGFGVAVLRLHLRPPEDRMTRACPWPPPGAGRRPAGAGGGAGTGGGGEGPRISVIQVLQVFSAQVRFRSARSLPITNRVAR